ncbi:Glycosyltransferase-like domain-containing protein 1 [Holothuria leucospilota]|uniref:tRNA-queuosine alpha-mannosyltransferase n=1 Tax=Holothuria leucospilota TaxID=206669 RepID=A0A9Q1BGR6_HOLLE|nr:Glycosyltransferase-like domain-containing protein 1 [Holothuria leucospilota]
MGKVLVLEPFCGESHRVLVDFLDEQFETVTFTLPPQKWHWKARTSALYLAQIIPDNDEMKCRTLFASSVLNLAELVALRPDLATLKKVLYFHENQLVYPVRKQQERDFQYGYNQILSSMVADVVVFNSSYNMTSFLQSIASYLKLIPDHRPKNISKLIEHKCTVLYLPLTVIKLSSSFGSDGDDSMYGCSDQADAKYRQLNEVIQCSVNCNLNKMSESTVTSSDTEKGREPSLARGVNCQQVSSHVGRQELNDNAQNDQMSVTKGEEFCDAGDSSTESSSVSSPLASCMHEDLGRRNCLHIVWPHRWEHDKNPNLFFETLLKLQGNGFDFRVSVLGGQFSQVPGIFDEAKEKLSRRIFHWGYHTSKKSYYSILRSADVVVSTADHEFFGLAMLEAAYLGCYPLCPNRLAYPEFFPKQCLYNTSQQLYKRLREFCQRPWLAKQTPEVNFGLFSGEVLVPQYEKLLEAEIRRST